MKYKRLLTAFMTAALITGSIAPQAMAANFADINDVPWDGAKTYINAVADAGLMVGDYNAQGQKVFRARDKVSYCETMQLVYSLMKSYTGKAVDSSVVTKYTTVMSGYKIPSWAYECVAYGLENGIVTISDIPGFINSSGASVNATRQDVAIMMGRALKDFETVNNNATLSFKDASSVASIAVPYVDLLNRLGIITGDDNGNFNPKNYINRAEMAVIVSKTNDLIKSKGNGGSSTQTSSVTGTVKSTQNVGGNIVLTVDTGSSTMSFSGATYLSCLSGSKVITLSDVAVGDKVLVSYNGQNIKSVVVTQPANSEETTEKETTVKGTYSSMNKTYITIKVDGTKKDYDLYDDEYVRFYYEDESLEYDEFKDKISSGDDVTLYLDSNGDVTKIDATEGDGDTDDDDYDYTGYFNKITTSYISLKKSKSSSTTKDYDFKNDDRDDVTFYIGSKEKDYDDFYDEVDDDSKIGLITNGDDEVTKVYLIDEDDSDYDEEGYFYKLSEEYIRITSKKGSSSYDEYDFKNKDSDDVTFYVDGKERDFDYFDDKAEKDFKIGLILNSDDEVTKIYMTTDDDDDDYDETGYLYKISSTYIRLMDNKNDDDYDDEYDYKNDDVDDVTFHINGKERDYDYFSDKVSKKDKIGLKLNSSKKVTDVYLISSSSSSTDDVKGEIRSISSSSVKIQGSSSNYRVDDADDIDVDVDDGRSNIDDYDDLVDALNDDNKIAEVTLEYDDDNYIISIEGYISGGTGLLSSIDTSGKKITIEFESGTTTKYDYKSSINVDLRYYSSNIEGLEKAIDGEKKADREVDITINSDGYITDIESNDI